MCFAWTTMPFYLYIFNPSDIFKVMIMTVATSKAVHTTVISVQLSCLFMYPLPVWQWSHPSTTFVYLLWTQTNGGYSLTAKTMTAVWDQFSCKDWKCPILCHIISVPVCKRLHWHCKPCSIFNGASCLKALTKEWEIYVAETCESRSLFDVKSVKWSFIDMSVFMYFYLPLHTLYTCIFIPPPSYSPSPVPLSPPQV